MAVILVIDPSPASRSSLVGHLAVGRHDVVAVSTADEALDAIDVQPVDVVLFDERLTGPSCMDLIHVICESPAVGSVAIASPGATFAGSMLAAGADEQLVTPVQAADLERAVQVALEARDTDTPEHELIEIGVVTVDRATGRAWRGDELIPLSTQERRILQLLAVRHGELVEISDIGAELGIRAGLERHVARLESRLDPHGSGGVLETFSGLGLRLLG